MTVDGNIYISGGSYYADPPAAADAEVGGYHVQLDDAFETFEEAQYAADQFSGAFPAYINGTYRVRVGDYLTRAEAEIAAATYETYTWYDMYGGVHEFSGAAAAPSATGVTITVTTTDQSCLNSTAPGQDLWGSCPTAGAGGGHLVQGLQVVRWL